jgi:hypothetical protein
MEVVALDGYLEARLTPTSQMQEMLNRNSCWGPPFLEDGSTFLSTCHELFHYSFDLKYTKQGVGLVSVACVLAWLGTVVSRPRLR